MAVNVCVVTHLAAEEKLLGGNGSRSKSLVSQVVKRMRETRGEKGAKLFHFTFAFPAFSRHSLSRYPESNTRMSFQISSVTSERCIKSKWKWQEETRTETLQRFGDFVSLRDSKPAGTKELQANVISLLTVMHLDDETSGKKTASRGGRYGKQEVFFST